VSETTADRQIVRAAGVVMVGFGLSTLLGLVTRVLYTREFGTSAEIDAFFAANKFPDMLFNLIAGGALASAFVPTFTGFLTHDDRSSAWRLASAVTNLIIVALSLSAALAWLLAPWLVRRVLVPGYQDAAQIQLTVSLLRVQLMAPVIFGVSGLLMGALNAHQHFILPALAPTFYWLGWIVGMRFLVPRWGIHGLAWGIVLGSALHLSIQLPGLWQVGGRYTLTLGLDQPAVRQVGRLMVPRLLGVAVVELNFLVNIILASAMEEGSLTALTLGRAVMMMPEIIIAQSIAIAALPTFSAQAASGRVGEMRASLANTLRGVVFLSLPASLGLILLRKTIVSLLFERGAFDASSTELVAWALLWYAAGLIGHSVLEIIVRAFYAMKDTRSPVIVGALAMSLNVVFSLIFSPWFARIGWAPYGGLALANSLATALECLILLSMIRRRLGGLDLRRLRRGLVASVAATTTMGVVLLVWLTISDGSPMWLIGGAGVAIGVVVYWLTALALGAPEARQLPGILRRREM